MPTTKTIRPKQSDASDAPLADSDIDALLSQADALMNDVQANLDEQDADMVAADNAQAIHVMAEEITTSADSADANAIMAMLNQDSASEASIEAVSNVLSAGADETANQVNEAEAANQVASLENEIASTEGPQDLSDEWFKQTNTSDELIPHIPDDNSSPPVDNQSVDANPPTHKAVKTAKWLGNAASWVWLRLLRLPLDILVLLDRPFARMNPSTKSYIGYAAISTSIVAIATWVYGDLRPTS